MANRFQKFLYLLSAEAPLLIMFAIVWLIKESNWSKPYQVSWQIPVILIVISASLIVAFNIVFNYGQKNVQVMHITATNSSGGDAWLVTYIISYIFPLASFQIGDFIVQILVVAIVLLIIAMTFTDFMMPHPILYLRGYHFYTLDVEGAHTGYYLVSKKKLKGPANVKKVSQVFEFLLLRQE